MLLVIVLVRVRYTYLPYLVQAIHGVAVYPKSIKIAHGAGVSLKNDDLFGRSVSLSADGTKLAVGAWGDDTGGTNRGAVYLFTISGSGSTWGSGVSQKYKIANNNDSFGNSVSLSADGTKLAVGTPGDDTGGSDSDRGAVYLFTISGSGSTWGSGVSQKLKIAHGAGVSLNNSDYFGISVSLSADGTKLAVGAATDDTGGSDRGAVYLFTISGSGSTWGSGVSRKLKIAHGAGVSLNDGDIFGRSVSLSADGTKLAVGAALDDTGESDSDRGAVYLFTISGSSSTWGSGVSRKLKIAHGAGVSLNNSDFFGISVSLSADGTKISGGGYE